MEAVIFIGLQASGKSTFFKERFFDSHVRINLDMLRTRHREKQLLKACIAAKQPFVVDNTNPTQADRLRYIPLAKQAGFRVTGYYFRSQIAACKARNEQRPTHQVVPVSGLISTYGQLVLPTVDEGYDALFYVSIGGNRRFTVAEWNDEI